MEMSAIVTIGASLVVLAVLILLWNANREKKTEAAPTTRHSPDSVRVIPAKPPPARKKSGEDRVLSGSKRPGRPAPKLTAATRSQCLSLYEEAKEAYNRAQQEKRKDDHDIDVFWAELRSCKAKLAEASGLLSSVLEWEEEASENDWQIPAHVKKSMSLFTKLSRLETKAVHISRGM